MAGAWPDRAGDPFADWMNSVQKYVVSDTLSDGDITGSRRRSSAAPISSQDVSTLRDAAGRRHQRHGQRDDSSRALLAADLVDELVLMIEPIVLGGGKSIFPGRRRGATVRADIGDDRELPACRSAATSAPADDSSACRSLGQS